MRIVVAALLLGVVLSGCLASGGSGFDTAGSVEARAFAGARDWNEGAVLVSVEGHEPQQARELNGSMGDAARYLARQVDPNVPDGRAQAWAYTFRAVADGGDLQYWRMVVKNEDGGIITQYEYQRQEEGFDLMAVAGMDESSVAIDSDAAILAAIDGSEVFARIANGTDAEGVMFLSDIDDEWGPAWVLRYESETDALAATVIVSARDGSIIPTEMYVVVPPPEPQADSFDGRINVAQPRGQRPFALAHGHDAFDVILRASQAPAGAVVSLTLLPGQGDEHRLEVTVPAGGGPASTNLTIREPYGGAWQANVLLEDGPLADFEVLWCAATDEDRATGACQGDAPARFA